jgi:uncharacterized protein with HEPN domain
MDCRSRKGPSSPVDDRTYNLLQALASTLQAIEAYEKYTTGEDEDIFLDLLRDQRRHAVRLMDEVMARLEAAGEAAENISIEHPKGG